MIPFSVSVCAALGVALGAALGVAQEAVLWYRICQVDAIKEVASVHLLSVYWHQWAAVASVHLVSVYWYYRWAVLVNVVHLLPPK